MKNSNKYNLFFLYKTIDNPASAESEEELFNLSNSENNIANKYSAILDKAREENVEIYYDQYDDTDLMLVRQIQLNNMKYIKYNIKPIIERYVIDMSNAYDARRSVIDIARVLFENSIEIPLKNRIFVYEYVLSKIKYKNISEDLTIFLLEQHIKLLKEKHEHE